GIMLPCRRGLQEAPNLLVAYHKRAHMSGWYCRDACPGGIPAHFRRPCGVALQVAEPRDLPGRRAAFAIAFLPRGMLSCACPPPIPLTYGAGSCRIRCVFLTEPRLRRSTLTTSELRRFASCKSCRSGNRQ